MSKQNDKDDPNRYVRYCRNGCGKKIYFDDKIRSKSGKPIPQEFLEDISHECPKLPPYKKKYSQGVDLEFNNQENQNKVEDNPGWTGNRNSLLEHMTEIIEYDSKQQEQILINQNQIKNQQKELMQLLLELAKKWS